MKKQLNAVLCMAAGILLPQLLWAQTNDQSTAGKIGGLQQVLDGLYEEMLPLCSQLIGVGRGIAAFAATWYIGVRVWRHIANAEPVDLFPLFRPFVIGFAILIFPSVLDLIGGVMKPTVTATAAMVDNSNKAIENLLKEREKALKESDTWKMYVGMDGSGDREQWYKYTHGDEKEGLLEGVGNDIRFAMAKASYSFRNSIKEWMSQVLQVLYEAAALCINTIRTFYLIVLAILGPLVFGISVFDGFQHTLTVWLARYLNVFLWLPVANLFGGIIGKAQEKLLALDIGRITSSGDTFFNTTDTAYLIFMVIGIIGYFTVPSVANYIIHAGGGDALLNKVTHFSGGSSSMIASGGSSMVRSVYGDAASSIRNDMASMGAGKGYFGNGSEFQKDKLSGK
ncbi:conjugative transposon protein TraJ [Paraflavisolibacter sp. H34]|uniref:conjugative transposon protein TraJ n=1 Tax=Huijunlia imazamoxiresistens TaxID=3127457 RepID=UPI0030180056